MHTRTHTHTHTRLKRMLFNLTKNPISSTSKNLISSYQPDLLCVNVCVVCVCVCVCGLRGREREGKRVCAIDVTVCRCIDVKLCRVREKHLCNYFVTPSTLLFHDLVKQLELFRIGFWKWPLLLFDNTGQDANFQGLSSLSSYKHYKNKQG